MIRTANTLGIFSLEKPKPKPKHLNHFSVLHSALTIALTKGASSALSFIARAAGSSYGQAEISSTFPMAALAKYGLSRGRVVGWE